MAEQVRASIIGGTHPLAVADVEAVHQPDFMPGDPYEFHIVLNRSLDALELRVADEVGVPRSVELGFDYLRVVQPIEDVDSSDITYFLETLNARVSQRRDEAAAEKEHLRAQGQRLKAALRPNG